MATATPTRPVVTRPAAPNPSAAVGGDLIERETPATLEAMTRGEIDVQITTARRYPRSIRTFIDTALEMATLDEDTAKACFYALPRREADGNTKTITGPSARLAEICANAYGHLRVQARIVDEDARFITAQAVAWDVQNNVAIGFEVRRRITGRNGQKYNDDMVGVTGNAAASIALRNAVFKVIPSAFWRPIFDRARVVAVGKAETLAARRAKMLEHFQKLGVENARVFTLLNVKGVEDITLEHMETLVGLATAIKEESTDIDEAFPPLTAMPKRTAENGNGQQTAGGGQQPPAQTSGAEGSTQDAGSIRLGNAATPAAGSDQPAPSVQTGHNLEELRVMARSNGGEWAVASGTAIRCSRSIRRSLTTLKDAANGGRGRPHVQRQGGTAGAPHQDGFAGVAVAKRTSHRRSTTAPKRGRQSRLKSLTFTLPVFSPEEFIAEAERVERVAIQLTDPTVQSGLGRVALMLRRAAKDRAYAIEEGPL
jgi:hypothetical protein